MWFHIGVYFLTVFALAHCLNIDHRLCKLTQIDDSEFEENEIEAFNNQKIYPRIKSLLQNDYFRFYKVNLQRKCPFWSDDSRCSLRFCHIVQNDVIPSEIKWSNSFFEWPLEDSDESDCDEELSYLNTSISPDKNMELSLWKFYDDSFCIEQEDESAQFIDLSINPERFTGYKGESARKIWNSIYNENCFR